MKDKAKKTKGRKTFFGVPIACLVLTAVVFSHIGWLVENAARIYFAGKIDARFYVLPFISAYGVIPFAFHGILRDPADIRFFGKKLPFSDGKAGKFLNNAIALLSMVIFVFVAELFVGNLFEMLFGVQLWNYSAHPLHVTRYTGVYTSLAFGTGAFILYKTLYRWLLKSFSKASYRVILVLAWVLGTLIILDTLNMILYMAVVGEAPMLWYIQVR